MCAVVKQELYNLRSAEGFCYYGNVHGYRHDLNDFLDHEIAKGQHASLLVNRSQPYHNLGFSTSRGQAVQYQLIHATPYLL